MFPAHPANRGGRVDETTVGGDMGERHQRHPVVHHLVKSINGDLTRRFRRNHLDDGFRLADPLQVGDEVRCVRRLRGEDAVALLQPKGVEGHIPGPGRAVGERDLGGIRPDQGPDGLVDALELPGNSGSGFVATHLGLEAKVLDDPIHHHLGHQRGTGVIEVQDVVAARCLSSRPGDVDHHGLSVG